MKRIDMFKEKIKDLEFAVDIDKNINIVDLSGHEDRINQCQRVIDSLTFLKKEKELYQIPLVFEVKTASMYDRHRLEFTQNRGKFWICNKFMKNIYFDVGVEVNKAEEEEEVKKLQIKKMLNNNRDELDQLISCYQDILEESEEAVNFLNEELIEISSS